MNWLISEPYDNFNFTKEPKLLSENVKKWNKISAEENYLINLNRYFNKTKSENTVLAKVIINSKKALTKKLHFGYSDKIRIFLNSGKLFEGDNTYQESDRYEDRGYVLDKFEVIELPLVKGVNELIMEVSEDKFGWGFIARISDLTDVEIINK